MILTEITRAEGSIAFPKDPSDRRVLGFLAPPLGNEHKPVASGQLGSLRCRSPGFTLTQSESEMMALSGDCGRQPSLGNS